MEQTYLFDNKVPDFYSEPCDIFGCEYSAKFRTEWCGVNQYGKREVVVGERNVCEGHLFNGFVHWEFGGDPDYIVEIKGERDRKDLLDRLKK